MGLFEKIKKENINFNTPQEMYQDNRKKTINGPLDYQSKMIDAYMDKGYTAGNVALELPTGAGKTLIGLLIGEFRRRKNKEKIVFVCPNNQLVNQVVEKANNVYGIKAYGFTGPLKDYDPHAKSAYRRADAIAVTNYSSIFLKDPFFNDADIIIFDDAHGAENYISSNWSLEINRKEHTDLYNSLVETIKDEIDDSQYTYLKCEQADKETLTWVDKFPNLKFIKLKKKLSDIISPRVNKENSLVYPWNNIKEHLHACNLFLSWESLLIRPYIPPTLTHKPFADAKQRIYMSATLGESGELERIIGVSKIVRLPISEEWKQKSIGRRYFVFPDASFNPKEYQELFVEMNKKVPRSLILVQDNKSVSNFSQVIEKNLDSKIFRISDIEKCPDDFFNSSDGIAVLANRYDGIDLEGDKCHLMFIRQIPNGTSLQEKFLSVKLAASVLFEERVRTKLIQAVGRCTRSSTDYATVCIMGDDLTNILTTTKYIKKYPPELRAEIEFGYTYSEGQNDYTNILLSMDALMEKTDDWDDAEEQILALRDEYIIDEDIEESKVNKNLNICAVLEVELQYALWKCDYESALNNATQIISNLDGKILIGYKAYWNYVAAYISYLNHEETKQNAYFEKMKEYLKEASNNSRNVSWFRRIVPKENSRETEEKNNNEFGLIDIVERIEEQFGKFGLRNSRKFEERTAEIMKQLRSDDGDEFERGHEALGKLLGYQVGNSTEHSTPDPWWIINEEYCIVSEDKIYTSNKRKILTKHIRQALTHEDWIYKNIDFLNKDASVATIFITTTEEYETNVNIYSKNICLVIQKEFIKWAEKAIHAVRKIKDTFTDTGDISWRQDAMAILIEEKVTPNDYIEFINQKKVAEL